MTNSSDVQPSPQQVAWARFCLEWHVHQAAECRARDHAAREALLPDDARKLAA